MAAAVFPAEAQWLADDFAVKAGGGVLRDTMEDGHVQQTPLASLARYELACTYRLPSAAARQRFEAWRADTLRNGALAFVWPDPHDWTGTTLRRARIVDGTVEYKAQSNRLDDFTVTFTLEFWS